MHTIENLLGGGNPAARIARPTPSARIGRETLDG